jgi:hypothetical protein
MTHLVLRDTREGKECAGYEKLDYLPSLTNLTNQTYLTNLINLTYINNRVNITVFPSLSLASNNLI